MENTFTTSFRRVLYLQKLLSGALDWLALDDSTPSSMKMDIKTVNNAMKRLTENSRHRAFLNSGSDDNWQKVKTDLEGEQLQDVMLLIEAVQDVKNVDQIVEIITANKVVAE